MKIRHLSTRFVRALWRGKPRAQDVYWAQQVLGPDAFALWQRQPRHDRRHSAGVARAVQRSLAGTPDASDSRWYACALLHDVGKLDARLGVYGRAVATVAGAAAGRDTAGAWSERTGFTRRVGLYLRHPELGAVRIRMAGGAEEAAAWAAAHHDPDTWGSLPIPAPVVAALAVADDD